LDTETVDMAIKCSISDCNKRLEIYERSPAERKYEKDFASRFETLFRFKAQHSMEKTLVDNRIIGKRRDICAMRRANDRAWSGDKPFNSVT
jgi:hypothetical protein